MIRIFLGKPGGGKSFGALKDIYDEAVNGQRVIVTNLSIDIGRFSALVQKRHPKADFDPNKRFRLLTDQECKRFWLHRRPGLSIPDITKEQEHGQDWFKVPEDTFGCLFVLDEAHIHFDARSWAMNGLSLTYYNSQHRKFSDEVVFVTQFLDLLDKRVRGFAQEYVYFVNNGLQRYLTYFRLPAYFTVKTYTKPRNDGPQGDVAQAVTRYDLDKELADCYDTSAGVGIPGRKQPETKRLKGVNLFWIAVPLAIVGWLLLKTPEVVSSVVLSAVERTEQPKAKREDLAVYHPEGLPGPVPQGTRATSAPKDGLPTVASAPSLPVYVRSYAFRGSEAIVTLTTGEIVTRASGLVALTKDFAFMKDGKKYQVLRGAMPPKAERASATPAGG